MIVTLNKLQAQNNPLLCPTFNPQNAEGRKYLQAAEATGIDPILLGMIVKNEWNFAAVEQIVPFFATLGDANYSYGVAQVQGPTALQTIEKLVYPQFNGVTITHAARLIGGA